jgi:hypothetical protein
MRVLGLGGKKMLQGVMGRWPGDSGGFDHVNGTLIMDDSCHVI